MLEIEQKYRIANPRRMRLRILKAGARKIRGGLEDNMFFDLGTRYRKQKTALRLRRLNHEGWFTLKGPKQRSRYSKRLEIQTTVEYKKAFNLLKHMGFRVFASYRKRRDEYALGSCLVTLDYMPKLRRWFLEIEGKPRAIDRVAKKLALKKSGLERKSYYEILFGPHRIA